jgi:hypothetical protein
MMIRISVLSIMFALAVGAAGAQQLPPQPKAMIKSVPPAILT